MGIDLKKGSISLKKGEAISLRKPEIVGNDIVFGTTGFNGMLRLGLGWDPITASSGGGFFGLFKSLTSNDIDCDSFAIMLDSNSKYQECVYFGHMTNQNNSVRLLGDNLTGEGEGDDETILIDLSKVPSNKVLVGMNIYRGRERGQSLGSLKNAYIHLTDDSTGIEIAHYNITPDDGKALGLKFIELFRGNDNMWYCNTLSEKIYVGSISDIVDEYK